MKYWNFRVIRRQISGYNLFQVHRVFYADAEMTKPILIENAPTSICGGDIRVMLDDIDLIVSAFSEPTIHLPEWDCEPTVK